MTLLTPAQDWAWMQQHWQLATLIAVCAVLALWASFRAVRAATKRLHLDTALRAIATPGTLLWEAQGTYVLARMMGMPVEIAAVGCTITSTAVVVLAHQAHRHFQRHGTLGPAGRLTWYVAAPMAVAVALTQHTIAYGFARLVVPLMAVLLWYSQYAPDEPAGERRKRKRGRWVWTPERLLVTAGLLAPTEADLTDSNATLRTRKLKRHGNGLWHGPTWLRAWHGARLRRIAEVSTDDELAEAQRSVTRVHHVQALIAPGAGPGVGAVLPSGWWRHPWTSARQSAAESVRFAEQVAGLNRELADLRERTERAQQQAADARTEAEQAARERRERRLPDRTGPDAKRGNQQATATIVPDGQLVEKLWPAYVRRVQEGGSLPTRYWVEQNGPCFARQANRVLELLASRWAGQGSSGADEQATEQSAI